MKKVLLIVLFIIPTIISNAQVTSLNETFNAFCDVQGQNYPTHWAQYGEYAIASLEWSCGPTDGRGSTPSSTSPGIECSNNVGTTNFVDTAWLLTPQMNLSFYAGNIYLEFDTKYLNTAGRLSLLVSDNYQAGTLPGTNSGNTWSDLSAMATPVLDNTGSSSWVTHVIDLTAYKSSPFYVAFRYTSNATGKSTWIIDNVKTTQTPSGIPAIEEQPLSLTVLGSTTPRQVTLSYYAPAAAVYQLVLYDILGHIVDKENINARPGTHNYTISGLDLHEGMYLVKMENGDTYSTAKVMIR